MQGGDDSKDNKQLLFHSIPVLSSLAGAGGESPQCTAELARDQLAGEGQARQETAGVGSRARKVAGQLPSSPPVEGQREREREREIDLFRG